MITDVSKSAVRDFLSIRVRAATQRQRILMDQMKANTQPWCFSRTACLGNDVFKLLDIPWLRINIQKGRADYLMQSQDMDRRPLPFTTYHWLKRKYIWSVLVEQEFQWFATQTSPKFILMDSFSELTDQVFSSRERGVSFCAHFGDLDFEQSSVRSLESSGLMSVTDFQPAYAKLFEEFHTRWPGTPVIFLHFPGHLETRPEYRLRALSIITAMDNLARVDPLLVPVEIENHTPTFPSRHPPEDFFPYHYDDGTYVRFAQLTKDIIRSHTS